MGMFDSIRGEVSCPHCNEMSPIEIQFKWGDCILWDYEIGDAIEDANSGIQVIEEDFNYCERCKTQFNVYVILRDRKIIAILNEEQNLKIKYDDLPDVEDNFIKKRRYENDCELGLGQSQEYSGFNHHPKVPGQILVALGHQWTVQEIYKKTIDEKHPLVAFNKISGCLSRNSDLWHVYKVYNTHFGERWMEVEDYIPFATDERYGNMTITKNLNLKDGYLLERIG